jgi:hypothetical protein
MDSNPVYTDGVTVTGDGTTKHPLSAGASAPAVKFASITLTSAELLALSTNPIIFLPAQGAGVIIGIVAVRAIFNFRTTPYTVPGGANFGFQTPTSGGVNVNFPYAGLVDQTESTYQDWPFLNPASGDTSQGLAGWINEPLQIIGSAPITNGDGTLCIQIVYVAEPQS